MSPSSLLFLFLIIITTIPTATATKVGITYSGTSSTSRIISVLTSTLKTPTIRLTNPSPSLTRAFSFTNVSLLLSIPNSMIPMLSSNRSSALLWLNHHVFPFFPHSLISTISIGNVMLDDDTNNSLSQLILPAIQNLYLSLLDLRITKISISTTLSFSNIVTRPFPPSSARFKQPLASTFILPLLQFLQDTNSSFLVNLYPYEVYNLNSDVPLGFAVFQENPFGFRDDPVTKMRYWNLFDMMVDALFTAKQVAGFDDVPVVVAETGWPSGDDESVKYAEMYLKGLLKHLRSPLMNGVVKEVYVYELIDENEQSKWGIMYPNFTFKFDDIQFSDADAIVEVCMLPYMLWTVSVFVFLGSIWQ